jgi:hypothetical protein
MDYLGVPISQPRPLSPTISTAEAPILFMASWPRTYLYTLDRKHLPGLQLSGVETLINDS